MTNPTGKELVSAGHAFAKAISMDTPLIVIAKMVSDLSTRLDCAIERGNELQRERDSLAAENEQLRQINALCGNIANSLLSEEDAQNFAAQIHANKDGE